MIEKNMQHPNVIIMFKKKVRKKKSKQEVSLNIYIYEDDFATQALSQTRF